MAEMDQDTSQEQQYEITPSTLAELHGIAWQMQSAGDPRAAKLWNFIESQSGGGDASGGPSFTFRQSPPQVTSWQEDLENELWGANAEEIDSQPAALGKIGQPVTGEAVSGAARESFTTHQPAETPELQPRQQSLQDSTPDRSAQQSTSPPQPQPQLQANEQKQPILQTSPGNNPGQRIHLIAYTVGNPSGDEDFKKAAYTRAGDIRNSKSFSPDNDTVLVYGLQSKDNFKWALQDASSLGNIQELTLFSHGGRNDGPIFHNSAGAEENLTQEEAAGLKINFTPSAHADFMACHTATNGFSRSFANAHRVLALGFAGTTFSGEPNQKIYGYKSGDREYMLGSEGVLNRAWHRIIGGDELKGPQFFYPAQ